MHKKSNLANQENRYLKPLSEGIEIEARVQMDMREIITIIIIIISEK